MQITFLTLFPKIIEDYISHSIIARSCEKKIITINTVNIRDFSHDNYKTCDDTPYGGGSGMLLMPQPLDDAICSVKTDSTCVIFPTPSAPVFTQYDAQDISQKTDIVFICGRYEGIDERIIDMHVHKRYSLGEYVISSGELASLVIVDAIYRLIKGVITSESLEEESYNDGLLEYPQYTRPMCFKGEKVPEVLYSGNHAEIRKWKHVKRLEYTRKFRPDLYKEYNNVEKN